MPHAAVRLRPGVNQTETAALNEAGISTSDQIRFFYDPILGAICQKLGGWDRFYLNTTSAIVRALWAWESTENQAFLALGTQNIGSTFAAQLGAITGGALQNITPNSATSNVSPGASTTLGNSIVTLTDASIGTITTYDSVYIPCHIAVGGLILFGLYQADPDGYLDATTFTIQSIDKLGNPLPAPSSSTSPVVAQFTTTSGSSTVTVTLPSHGYVVGSLYPVCVETIVGGVTFYGHYSVQQVTDANNFVIVGTTTATGSTSGYINNGKARYVYGFAVGSIPGGTGYGIGTYGGGGYGTGTAVPPASLGSPISANDWTIDNWGEVLVACAISPTITLTTVSASGTGTTGTIVFAETYTAPIGDLVTVAGVTPSTWNGNYLATGSTSHSISFATATSSAITVQGTITVNEAPYQPIYVWDSEGGAPTASTLYAGPPVNDGIFVAMPQRQIIAWGSTFTGIPDPLLIRWCDVNNYNTWLATATNQAGSFRIPRGSKIVGAIQGPQQGLVWTDVGIWSMQYVGLPYVYSFNEIGYGCGLIGRKAAASVNGEVYWMGPSQFFTLSGDGVSPLPCPIWDVVFQDLDQANLNRIRVAVNSRFNEIAWYYPTTTSNGEVAAYVKYNIVLQAWDYGSIARSAWIDQSVLGPPIGADPNSFYLYQHETSPDADGQAMTPTFRTGYYAMQEGDLKTFVDQVWPDFKYGVYGGAQNATVNLTFYVADYPGQTPTAYGPYAFTQASTFVTPRFRGRLVALEIGSDDVGSFWRIGLIRYRFQPDGQF